jgi:hypothetical protein
MSLAALPLALKSQVSLLTPTRAGFVFSSVVDLLCDSLGPDSVVSSDFLQPPEITRAEFFAHDSRESP